MILVGEDELTIVMVQFENRNSSKAVTGGPPVVDVEK